MSYSFEDDDVKVESIDFAKSEHETDIVSNVIYGGKTNRKDPKKVKDREEQFMHGLNL